MAVAATSVWGPRAAGSEPLVHEDTVKQVRFCPSLCQSACVRLQRRPPQSMTRHHLGVGEHPRTFAGRLNQQRLQCGLAFVIVVSAQTDCARALLRHEARSQRRELTVLQARPAMSVCRRLPAWPAPVRTASPNRDVRTVCSDGNATRTVGGAAASGFASPVATMRVNVLSQAGCKTPSDDVWWSHSVSSARRRQRAHTGQPLRGPSPHHRERRGPRIGARGPRTAPLALCGPACGARRGPAPAVQGLQHRPSESCPDGRERTGPGVRTAPHPKPPASDDGRSMAGRRRLGELLRGPRGRQDCGCSVRRRSRDRARRASRGRRPARLAPPARHEGPCQSGSWTWRPAPSVWRHVRQSPARTGPVANVARAQATAGACVSVRVHVRAGDRDRVEVWNGRACARACVSVGACVRVGVTWSMRSQSSAVRLADETTTRR